MIKQLRRRIRLINYYSAPRRRTVWTKAFDVGMLAAVLVAVLAQFLAGLMVERRQVMFERYFRVLELPDGLLEAQLLDPELKASGWGGVQPFAEVTITVVDEHKGWPLAISTTRLPTELSLKIFTNASADPSVEFAPGSPLRAVIDNEILLQGDTAASDALAVSQTQTRSSVMAWIFGWMLWWIILIVAWYMLLQIARAGWYVISQKSRLRARELRMENRCANCGYDMRGLEFRDRCPECGTLVS